MVKTWWFVSHENYKIIHKKLARYEEVTEENLVVNGKIYDLNKDLVDDNKKNNISFFTKKLDHGEGEMKEYLGLLKDIYLLIETYLEKNQRELDG